MKLLKTCVITILLCSLSSGCIYLDDFNSDSKEKQLKEGRITPGEYTTKKNDELFR